MSTKRVKQVLFLQQDWGYTIKNRDWIIWAVDKNPLSQLCVCVSPFCHNSICRNDTQICEVLEEVSWNRRPWNSTHLSIHMYVNTANIIYVQYQGGILPSLTSHNWLPMISFQSQSCSLKNITLYHLPSTSINKKNIQTWKLNKWTVENP